MSTKVPAMKANIYQVLAINIDAEEWISSLLMNFLSTLWRHSIMSTTNNIVLTAPLNVQWRKSCTTKGAITKSSRLMQLQSLSSLSGLVSLSSSSKSERFLLWSLNPPLCYSSVAKLTQHFFLIIILCRNSLVHVASAHERYMQGSPDRQKCLNYVLPCKQWWNSLCPTFSLSERRRNQNSECSFAFNGIQIIWWMVHWPQNSIYEYWPAAGFV